MIIAVHLCLQPAAAFEYRETSPASLFPSGMAVHDPALPETVVNPAYLPLVGNSYVSAAGSRPYSLEEMASFLVRSGLCGEWAGFQVSWGGFGIEEYREQTVDISAGIRPMQHLSMGLGAVYSSVAIRCDGHERNIGIWETHAAVLLEPCGWLTLTFRQENILTYLYRARRDVMYPVWSAGAALRPMRGVDILYGISATNFGLLNSAALSARVFPFLCLVAGYQHETGIIGAAFIISLDRLMVSYGFRYHQVLGMTHSVGVTVTLEGRPFEHVDYGGGKRERPDPLKKIDINSCGKEDLERVPLLTEKQRVMIMNHREKVGPLSRNNLYQFGMKVREVEDLLDYVYGLAEPERKDGWKERYKKGAGGRGNKRKSVFLKLVGLGLKATTALKLSELSAAGKKDDLRREIETLDGISGDTRKKIGTVCAGPSH